MFVLPQGSSLALERAAPRQPEEGKIGEDTFDACVIGPVARDINTIGDTEYAPRPGGATG